MLGPTRHSVATGTGWRSLWARATTWPPRSVSVSTAATRWSRSERRALHSPSPIDPPPIRRARSPASPTATGRFLPLVCTSNAAKVLDAVARLLGVDHDEFDRLALAASGDRRPVLLPYFDGERTPNRPDATGVLSGLRSDVSREEFARAAVDGVACGMLDALDSLRANSALDGRLVLTGGGARSRCAAGGDRRVGRRRGGGGRRRPGSGDRCCGPGGRGRRRDATTARSSSSGGSAAGRRWTMQSTPARCASATANSATRRRDRPVRRTRPRTGCNVRRRSRRAA